MGETIAESTCAATILRNIHKSWRPITQTIRVVTQDPNTIKEWLEAHKADLSTLKIFTQAMTAFIAQAKPKRPAAMQPPQQNTPNPKVNNTQTAESPQINQRPHTQCNNCRRISHLASKCYASGGGLEGQALWKMTPKQFYWSVPPTPKTTTTAQALGHQTTPQTTLTPQTSAQMAKQCTDFIMVVIIQLLPTDTPHRMSTNVHTVGCIYAAHPHIKPNIFKISIFPSTCNKILQKTSKTTLKNFSVFLLILFVRLLWFCVFLSKWHSHFWFHLKSKRVDRQFGRSQ